jgi:hypothetical protein
MAEDGNSLSLHRRLIFLSYPLNFRSYSATFLIAYFSRNPQVAADFFGGTFTAKIPLSALSWHLRALSCIFEAASRRSLLRRSRQGTFLCSFSNFPSLYLSHCSSSFTPLRIHDCIILKVGRQRHYSLANDGGNWENMANCVDEEMKFRYCNLVRFLFLHPE